MFWCFHKKDLSCSPLRSPDHFVSFGRRWKKTEWTVSAVVGSPVIVNGDEYENIELKQSGSDILSTSSGTAVVVSVAGSAGGALKRDVDNNISADPPPPVLAASAAESGVPPTDAERQRDSSSGYTSESGDMLRELVKNKDQIEVPSRSKKPPVKMGSADSEVSDTSNLASIFSVRFVLLLIPVVIMGPYFVIPVHVNLGPVGLGLVSFCVCFVFFLNYVTSVILLFFGCRYHFTQFPGNSL